LEEERFEVEVGRRIRQAREKRGWTQRQLAEALQLTQSTVSLYESGLRKASVHLMCRVASTLDVPVTDLLPIGTAEPFWPAGSELISLMKLLEQAPPEIAQDVRAYAEFRLSKRAAGAR
jgi:transcriptional regulator with XRE-family HTH domain